MESLLIITIILTILLIAGIAFRISSEREKKRRAFYQDWADKRGWTYNPNHDRDLPRRYAFLKRLNKGSNRYALHSLRGIWKDYPALAFTFHWATYTYVNKQMRAHHVYFGVILIELEQSFPTLQIHPEKITDKMSAFFGLDSNRISFESTEFSQQYAVRSPSRQFAYDFCHPQMMEYLLGQPGTKIEIQENLMVTYTQNRLENEDIDYHLDNLYRLRQLMPESLFTN